MGFFMVFSKYGGSSVCFALSSNAGTSLTTAAAPVPRPWGDSLQPRASLTPHDGLLHSIGWLWFILIYYVCNATYFKISLYCTVNVPQGEDRDFLTPKMTKFCTSATIACTTGECMTGANHCDPCRSLGAASGKWELGWAKTSVNFS